MAIVQQKVVVTVQVETSETEYGDSITQLVKTELDAVDGVRTVDIDFQNTGLLERLPSSPKADKERLIRLAAWAAGEQAKADLGLPSEWYQGQWLTERKGVATEGHCGTACCIAGKTALEDGWVPKRLSPAEGSGFSSTYVVKGNAENSVEDVARRALGLSYSDADRLFSGQNDLDDVLRIVGELIA